MPLVSRDPVCLPVGVAVVIDECADAGLGETDLGEDLVGGGGPGERLGGAVPVGDVVADLAGQGVDGGKGAAADRLAGDDPEPGLDLVDPGRADGGEVDVDMRVRVQPGGHVGGGQVVQDDVDLPADVRGDRVFQEREERGAVTDGRQAAKTSPVAVLRAANSLVVP